MLPRCETDVTFFVSGSVSATCTVFNRDRRPWAEIEVKFVHNNWPKYTAFYCFPANALNQMAQFITEDDVINFAYWRD